MVDRTKPVSSNRSPSPTEPPPPLTIGSTWPNLRNVQTDKIRKSYAHTTLLHEPTPAPDDLAFLQYTSGSTSAPKGYVRFLGVLCVYVGGVCVCHTSGLS